MLAWILEALLCRLFGWGFLRHPAPRHAPARPVRASDSVDKAPAPTMPVCELDPATEEPSPTPDFSAPEPANPPENSYQGMTPTSAGRSRAVVPAVSRAQVRDFRTEILDKLELYQTYIQRLRKWDPPAYKEYRRLGAFIPSDAARASPRALEPGLLRNLPAFGAIALDIGHPGEPHPDPDGYVPCRFAYFVKLERPGLDVERVALGTTYRCRSYYDDHRDVKLIKIGREKGAGFDTLVNVLPDGTVRALRTLKSDRQVIRHKHGANRGTTTIVHHQRWGLPAWEEHHNRDGAAQRITANFISVLNHWAICARQSMIRITATKGDVVMPFVVDPFAMPEFFRDRDPIITPSGSRRRMFHIVRPHMRQTARGPRAIKLHFAGQRTFSWNGYDIGISVPGKHHGDHSWIDFGAHEDVPAEEEAAGDFLSSVATLDFIADTIGAPAKLERQA
jgi:hypothetical protein